MRTTSIVLFVTAAAGCAHRSPPPGAPTRAEIREERREEVAEARREERRERIADRSGWVRLGERMVDGRNDRDVIPVGARDGTFRRIMIAVENSPVEMHHLVVNFRDGSHFSPATRLVFGANTRSSVIDLPGSERVIRSVEFRYGNLPHSGRAEVELWAQ